MNRVTDRQVDSIKASALDERRLLERAMLDAVESFGRFMLDGRTPHESIVLLQSWRELFERNGRRRHP